MVHILHGLWEDYYPMTRFRLCLLIANSIAELRTRGEAPSICFTHSTFQLWSSLLVCRMATYNPSRFKSKAPDSSLHLGAGLLVRLWNGIALLQTLCNISYCHTCIDTQYCEKVFSSFLILFLHICDTCIFQILK